MTLDLKIKEKDIVEILGISRNQLRQRIKDGIYPEPKKDSYNGRWVFTIPWLDSAKFNEREIQKAQLRVQKLKEEGIEQRKRFEKSVLESLD